jgi:hypothetical protein
MRAIEIQISAVVKAPRNGRRIPERVIREAIIRRSQTGTDVPGITLRIVRWRHGSTAGWKDVPDNSPDTWAKFARFLPGSSFVVSTVA